MRLKEERSLQWMKPSDESVEMMKIVIRERVTDVSSALVAEGEL